MSDWPSIPLESVTTLLTDGDWIEKRNQSDRGIRLLQTGNVGEGVFRPNIERARYISPETFQALNCTEVLPGDVLVSRLPDPIGRACLVPALEERLVTAVDCAIIRFTDEMLPEFFVHLTQSPHYLRNVAAQATGTTRQRISRSALSKIEIPLPPLNEQKRIVAKLDEAHSFVMQGEENHQAEVRARKALFMQALRNIFLDRATNEEWTIRTFGDFASHQLGKMLDKSKNSGELRPYLRNANIQWFRIDTSDVLRMRIEDSERDRFRVRYGDLLICEGGYPGRCALWQDDSEMYFQKALHRARFDSIEAAKWAQYFLFFMTESGRLQEHFSGTGIMHLTGERLARLSIPIPETAVLVSAVRTLDDLRLHLGALSEIQDAKGENLRNFNQRFAGNLLVGAL